MSYFSTSECFCYLIVWDRARTPRPKKYTDSSRLMYSWENTCIKTRLTHKWVWTLHSSQRDSFYSSAWGPWRRAKETPRYLEEEVEPKQSTAGDDGKPRCVSTGDRFWHVWRVLGKTEESSTCQLKTIQTPVLPAFNLITGARFRKQD